ncbi:methyltransferase domain-containing protein [Serratia fonticola]|uniref:class I SAM-dependent methyltransferase n=1 Tax=Serratia fonticola TaxID=47917 RepID=UPI001576D47F|nr:class I SAM-dependent methyltransferase [Serratia fonticola]NTY86601.1 methyltransferase domain-containing protein [Serratia fonticola]NTZ12677.1 methyltransferase domain-containing protein [Serratia fonticola]
MSINHNAPSELIIQPQNSSHEFDEKTFDAHADLYEKMFSAPYRQHLEIPTLGALLGDLSGLSILDFGCGPGFISRWLQGKGAHRVVGYDISEGMLSYAKFKEQQEPRGISYISTLNDSLSEQFDIVLAIYVMPYAPNKEKLLDMCQIMARLLKPGGRLITLPIHPEFSPDPEYYRPYGFRLIEKEARADGSLVNLHICHPPYDVNIDAHFWSELTLTSTLHNTGFHDISWHQLQPPQVGKEYDVSLDGYLRAPHAAIIEGIKVNSAKPQGGR